MNKTEIITPVRIMAESRTGNAEKLLGNGLTQIILRKNPDTVIKSGGYLILDYGKEICGGVKALVGEIVDEKGSLIEVGLRFRFGESVTESCAELGEKNAGNYHSIRDFTANVTTHGSMIYGNTGFRFLRIDNISNYDVSFYSLPAVNELFGGTKFGTFECSDPLVNKIFDTAVYTLDLCIQNGYLWDGIKRDRCVWIGDMHPEVLSTLWIHGNIDEVRASIEFCKLSTPENEWVNAIPSYSFWWILVFSEYVKYTGDFAYVRENKGFIEKILSQADECLDEVGTWDPRKGRTRYFEDNENFFDWPTNFTSDSEFGVRALMILAIGKVKELYSTDMEVLRACDSLLDRIYKKNTFVSKYKQVTAMRVLAGQDDGKRALQSLTADGANGMGCFMAYYILSAIAKLGAPEKAFSMLKEYFGGMLSMGATTFWEDFDVKWINGSARLDEFPCDGQKDIHGDFGKFCYQQFRHSLCHGWSTGGIAYLYEYVLGVKFVGIGCKEIHISPNLCGLKYAKGTFPTPYGVVSVFHKVDESGNIVTRYSAPKEIKVIIKDSREDK